MHDDIRKVLLSSNDISTRVDSLAQQITSDYEGRDVTAIAILSGSLLFTADLLRRIPLPFHLDTLRASSYHGTGSTGEITFHQTPVTDLRGRHILLVDDILDTGITLDAIRSRLSLAGAASLKTCVLLRKDVPRQRDVVSDYIGFDIPNEFVVGYGLDYNERYRNLPYIGVLTDEAIARGSQPTAS